MSKRTLDAFFAAPKPVKKPRLDSKPLKIDDDGVILLDSTPSPPPIAQPFAEPVIAIASSSHTQRNDPSNESEPDTAVRDHPAYPFPIRNLPSAISNHLSPLKPPRTIDNLPDLDLLYFEPFVPTRMSREYGEFLRRELPFYRVTYKINKFGKEQEINTPRYTTVFGIDAASQFDAEGNVVDSKTGKPVPGRYKTCRPRPIPHCLDQLRLAAEKATGARFNYALTNYYASGQDSISYHSDDEAFLEKEPAIASFSFLGSRDFLLKHKPPTKEDEKRGEAEYKAIVDASTKPLKYPLTSGTMVVMRGLTQPKWLHSIPKRSDSGARTAPVQGRINVTFRYNTSPAGSENYYRYNVGTGPVYRWNEKSRQMSLSTDAASVKSSA